MTILITGGAGFIGSNYISLLANRKQKDAKVIVLDKLTYAGSLDTLNRARGSFPITFYNVDICDKEKIFEIFHKEKPDVVVNFAAESHVDRSIHMPSLFYSTNTFGTLVLLEACRLFDIKRFHQVSTDEVYGDMPVDDTLSFSEKDMLNPTNIYASSKASADIIAQAYHKTYGLPITISRCTNNYGPFQFPEKFMPKIITNAIVGNTIPVYGNGQNRRNWIHVIDHCDAIEAIRQYGKTGNIYNISGDTEISNIELVKTILDMMNKDHDLITLVDDRVGHDRKYAITSIKISSELRWKAKVPFIPGVSKTIEWYNKNQSWWLPLKKGLNS